MNKLINDFDRGFSLKNDDLRFVDAAVRDALASICNGIAFQDSAYILYGCVVTIIGTTATVSKGAIFYENEIWAVEDHTFAVLDPLPDPPNWAFCETYDANGVKLDKDLASHNTYAVRSAIGYMVGGEPSGTIALVGMDLVPRLRELMLQRTNTYGAIVEYINDPIEGTVSIRKSNETVSLTGTLKKTLTPGTPIHLFTVPSGYRLGSKTAGITYGEKTSDSAVKIIEWYITSDGKFYAQPHDGELSVETSVTLFISIAYPIV